MRVFVPGLVFFETFGFEIGFRGEADFLFGWAGCGLDELADGVEDGLELFVMLLVFLLQIVDFF